MQRHFSLALVLVQLWGCTTDALYSYCTAPQQCGERTYYTDDDDKLSVPLDCIETQVQVSAGETTLGNSCTLDCGRDSDCDSRAGLGDGLCVSWDGSDDFFCYQRCEAGDACYPSSSCEEVMIEGEPFRVCLPTRS